VQALFEQLPRGAYDLGGEAAHSRIVAIFYHVVPAASHFVEVWGEIRRATKPLQGGLIVCVGEDR
jgi:hypothetical protein